MSRPPHLLSFSRFQDQRGRLVVAEDNEDLPFSLQRVYWITQTEDQGLRGAHAHKTLEKILICVQGEVQITLENQDGEQLKYILEQPDVGLYIPPMHWGEMKLAGGTILLSLNSALYNEEDYIRDYELFKSLSHVE